MVRTSFALVILGALVLSFDTAHAAPAGVSERTIDVDLKQAGVHNVFRLLSDIGGRPVTLDPCVQGNVDLRLQNAPLPLVFDALAAKLHLVYEDDAGGIVVRCAGTEAGAAPVPEATRVTLTAKELPLDEALALLAPAAKLDGVDYRATTKPKVDVKLRQVRVATAVAALADESGLRIVVAKKRLVVTD